MTLSCTAGLPAGAQCLFSPSTVTPGNSAANVVMNISTTKANIQQWEAFVPGQFPPPTIWLPVAAIVVSMGAFGNGTSNKWRQVLGAAIVGLAMMAFVSCAGVSSAGDGGQPPPPATYTVTVTGTSSDTPPDVHRTTVKLVVN